MWYTEGIESMAVIHSTSSSSPTIKYKLNLRHLSWNDNLICSGVLVAEDWSKGSMCGCWPRYYLIISTVFSQVFSWYYHRYHLIRSTYCSKTYQTINHQSPLSVAMALILTMVFVISATWINNSPPPPLVAMALMCWYFLLVLFKARQ